METSVVEEFLNFCIDLKLDKLWLFKWKIEVYLIHGLAIRTNLSDHIQLFIVLYNGKCLIIIRNDPLLYRLFIVISPALTPVQASLHTQVQWATQIKRKMDFGFIAHLSIPTIQIVTISGEAVDEIAFCIAWCQHGLKWRLDILDDRADRILKSGFREIKMILILKMAFLRFFRGQFRSQFKIRGPEADSNF